MLKAWVLAKMPLVEAKVKGVTHYNRQTAIDHLTRYNSQDITITLKREQNNLYDTNAIAVYVTVANKGSYNMGYLPRHLSIMIAPLMDKGKSVQGFLKEIRGRYADYMNYGLVIGVKI